MLLEAKKPSSPHIDARFLQLGLSEDGKEIVLDATVANEEVVSHLIVLFYLNDYFVFWGGRSLHQKETATGASGVAKTLGLESYMEFKLADAFDLDIEQDSIDMLWCEFASTAWKSIRPGGVLLCHSTLTNTRTREWLEATSVKLGGSVTGIPADEYIEISLLEPHKRFQNSVSILQKRAQGFQEPNYSEYA